MQTASFSISLSLPYLEEFRFPRRKIRDPEPLDNHRCEWDKSFVNLGRSQIHTSSVFVSRPPVSLSLHDSPHLHRNPCKYRKEIANEPSWVSHRRKQYDNGLLRNIYCNFKWASAFLFCSVSCLFASPKRNGKF